MTKLKEQLLDNCPTCGQATTLDIWIKQIKKSGLPSLAKLLTMTKIKKKKL